MVVEEFSQPIESEKYCTNLCLKNEFENYIASAAVSSFPLCAHSVNHFSFPIYTIVFELPTSADSNTFDLLSSSWDSFETLRAVIEAYFVASVSAPDAWPRDATSLDLQIESTSLGVASHSFSFRKDLNHTGKIISDYPFDSQACASAEVSVHIHDGEIRNDDDQLNASLNIAITLIVNPSSHFISHLLTGYGVVFDHSSEGNIETTLDNVSLSSGRWVCCVDVSMSQHDGYGHCTFPWDLCFHAVDASDEDRAEASHQGSLFHSAVSTAATIGRVDIKRKFIKRSDFATRMMEFYSLVLAESCHIPVPAEKFLFLVHCNDFSSSFPSAQITSVLARASRQALIKAIMNKPLLFYPFPRHREDASGNSAEGTPGARLSEISKTAISLLPTMGEGITRIILSSRDQIFQTAALALIGLHPSVSPDQVDVFAVSEDENLSHSINTQSNVAEIRAAEGGRTNTIPYFALPPLDQEEKFPVPTPERVKGAVERMLACRASVLMNLE